MVSVLNVYFKLTVPLLTALKLHPDSAIAHIEYANGLILLFGKSRLDEAQQLYEKAAACKPADAMEQLDVLFAQSELA